MTKRITLTIIVTILLITLATTVVVSAQPAATTALAQAEQTPAPEPAAPPAIGDIRTIPCPMNLPEGEVDGETVFCGQVIVPENWEQPGENMLNITFAILKASSGAPFAEPIMYLEGGPGGTALEDIESLSGHFAKLRETRDFIYYDQRGTAYSSNLECPLIVQAKPIVDAMAVAEAAAEEPADSDDAEGQTEDADAPDLPELPTFVPLIERDPQEILQEQRDYVVPTETGCRDYFEEQGIDLSQYTTANSIRDLIALMQGLDYDVYNVYGISYGSRLGLELLRVYSDADDSADLPEIRSVVIDGIDPPNVDTIPQSPFARMYVTLRTLSECEADEACGVAYPDARQQAIDLMAQVEEAPLEITSSDGMTETLSLDNVKALLTGMSVTDGEDSKAIGYAEVVPYLPKLVTELSSGVGDTYMGLKQGLLPPEPAAETEAGDLTVFDPLAMRSQQLAEEAETLAQELAILSAQSQRASDALANQEPLPEFFARELVQIVSEQPSFKEQGSFGGRLLLFEAVETPNRATLDEIIDLFDLSDAGQATLHGIANLMSDEEVTGTVKLILSDNIVEQLTEAIQDQMNTAVLCNDTYLQFDIESAWEAYKNAEAPQLLSGIGAFVTYIGRCERYNLTPEVGEPAEPVVSELPILVVNGGIDTTTPAEWGEAVAEHLPNSQLVTVPMYAHGATALSECGQDIVRYFFTYPEQEVNTACIEDLKPRFVLPDADQDQAEGADAAVDLQSDAGDLVADTAAESILSLTTRGGGGVYDRGPNSHASGMFRSPHYHVARGDTLFSIGRRFGVTPRQIARTNGLPGNRIYADQVLIIPGTKGGASGRPPTSGHYQRVHFGPGATDWSATGVIRNGHPKGYILGASRGQSLEINTQSHGEPLHVILERSDGRRVKLNGENNGISNHLFTTLPANGDYIVIVKPTSMPESPSLSFGITFVIL